MVGNCLTDDIVEHGLPSAEERGEERAQNEVPGIIKTEDTSGWIKRRGLDGVFLLLMLDSTYWSIINPARSDF
jgi:hypothetical protein